MSVAEAILEIDRLSVGYTDEPVVVDFSATIAEGTVTTIIGPNGAGKSTLLRAIYGLTRRFGGSVRFLDRAIEELPPRERLRLGIGFVPQGRCNFPLMTVRENLELGAVLRRGESLDEDFEQVHALFPRLYERRNQLAGTLSGGEQQMVAMGRALMSRPRLLLMDEPSMGLSPALVQQNFQIIKQIHSSGVAVLMVEQNAAMALSIADRGYVLSTGEIVLEGPASELLRSEDLKRAYLGR